VVLPALPTTTKVHTYNKWIARTCPRFAMLPALDSILGDGNSCPVDLPLLSGAAVNRPASMQKVAFSDTDRQTAGILMGAESLTERLRGRGIRELLAVSPLSVQLRHRDHCLSEFIIWRAKTCIRAYVKDTSLHTEKPRWADWNSLYEIETKWVATCLPPPQASLPPSPSTTPTTKT
jgi:hypothetical protein